MTVEDMRDYYRRFYHPGNATLVICGDVTRAAALRAVRRHFGGVRAGMDYEAAGLLPHPAAASGGGDATQA